MAAFPFGDPSNPYPTGYEPLKKPRPNAPDWTGGAAPGVYGGGAAGASLLSGTGAPAMPPGGPVRPGYDMMTQAIQSSLMRNPSLTTAPKTPRVPSAPTPAAPAAPAAPTSPGGGDDAAAYVPGVSGTMPVTPGGMAGPGTDPLGDYNAQQEDLIKWQMGTGGTGLALDEARETAKFGEGVGKGARVGGYGVVPNLTRALGGAAEGYFAGESKKERGEVRASLKRLQEQYEEARRLRKGGPQGDTAATKGEIEKDWGAGSYQLPGPSFLDPEDLI